MPLLNGIEIRLQQVSNIIRVLPFYEPLVRNLIELPLHL
jgi:hypothetical protein